MASASPKSGWLILLAYLASGLALGLADPWLGRLAQELGTKPGAATAGGAYYSAPPAGLSPPPRQPGGVPLWLGSWGSRAGLRRVARLGQHRGGQRQRLLRAAADQHLVRRPLLLADVEDRLLLVGRPPGEEVPSAAYERSGDDVDLDQLRQALLDPLQPRIQPVERYEDLADADVVITMGCGDACPIFPGKRYLDWQLDDPAGKGIDAVRPIRDEIDTRVRRLLAELVGEVPIR